MNYFHVICEITPYHKKPYLEHVVISEDPLDFMQRNKVGYQKLAHYGDHFQVNAIRSISRKSYKKNRKMINPRFSYATSMALYLTQADWSRFFTDRFGM